MITKHVSKSRFSIWRILLCTIGLLASAQSYAGAGPNPPVFTGGSTIFQIDEDSGQGFLDLRTIFDRGEPQAGPFFSGDDVLVFTVTPASPTGIVSLSQSGFQGAELFVDLEADANGTVTFTVEATDIVRSLATSVDLTLNVIAVNDAPESVGSLPNLTIDEDEAPVAPIDLAAAFTDIDDASLTYSIESRSPATGIVSATIAGDALSLVTLLNENGQVDFVIRGTDSAGAFAETNFTLNVTPVPDPPFVNNPVGALTVLEDDPAVRVNLVSVFADDDDSTLNYSIGAISPAGILNPSIQGTDLVLTQVPNATGTVSVDFRATDSEGQFIDTSLVLTITPVNDPPFVLSATNSVTHVEDAAGTLTVDASSWFDEVDVGDTLTFRILNVTGDTVLTTPTISAVGMIGYSLLPNAFGTTTIRVEVEDSAGETAFADLNVIVTPQNDPPVVAVAPVDVTELEDVGTVTVDLSTVFDDADITTSGDNLTLTLISSPTTALGPVALSGNSLTLTATPDANGVTTVTVEAADNFGLTVQTDFDITLTPVNDSPFVAVPVAPASFIEDMVGASISLSGVFDDVDIATNGDALNLSLISNSNPGLITGATVQGNNSCLLYTSPSPRD